MRILLEDTNDRIVTQYHGTNDRPSDLAVVYDSYAEIYYVVGHNDKSEYQPNEWHCYWRGDWRSTSNFWFEMVSDMEAEANQQ